MKNYLIILSLLVSVVLNSAHADSFDQRPVVRVQPQPAYPYKMSRAGISGHVIVQLTVDKKGNATNVRIVSSSHKGFEEAAIAAAEKWKFHPATQQGKPVEVTIRTRIDFGLE